MTTASRCARSTRRCNADPTPAVSNFTRRRRVGARHLDRLRPRLRDHGDDGDVHVHRRGGDRRARVRVRVHARRHRVRAVLRAAVHDHRPDRRPARAVRARQGPGRQRRPDAGLLRVAGDRCRPTRSRPTRPSSPARPRARSPARTCCSPSRPASPSRSSSARSTAAAFEGCEGLYELTEPRRPVRTRSPCARSTWPSRRTSTRRRRRRNWIVLGEPDTEIDSGPPAETQSASAAVHVLLRPDRRTGRDVRVLGRRVAVDAVQLAVHRRAAGRRRPGVRRGARVRGPRGQPLREHRRRADRRRDAGHLHLDGVPAAGSARVRHRHHASRRPSRPPAARRRSTRSASRPSARRRTWRCSSARSTVSRSSECELADGVRGPARRRARLPRARGRPGRAARRHARPSSGG